jgi:hypothetical protein
LTLCIFIFITNAEDLGIVEKYVDDLDPILKHILGISLDETDYWTELKVLLKPKNN